MELKNGNEEAFRTLFERYKGKILRFGMKLMGEPDYAEELCQEVFVKLYLHRKKYKSKGSFKSYIFRIAYTSALNILKRKGYRERKHLSLQSLKYEKGLEPFVWDEIDERAEIVRREFTSLPERQRAAIELALFHGMNYDEIEKFLAVQKEPQGSSSSEPKKN